MKCVCVGVRIIGLPTNSECTGELGPFSSVVSGSLNLETVGRCRMSSWDCTTSIIDFSHARVCIHRFALNPLPRHLVQARTPSSSSISTLMLSLLFKYCSILAKTVLSRAIHRCSPSNAFSKLPLSWSSTSFCHCMALIDDCVLCCGVGGTIFLHN